MEKTILVIDDEERIARSLQALLREEGYTVDLAIGGVQGLELLREKFYHLVITDLRMPEVDGFQVMDFISTHAPNTAALVITGHATTESAIEAIHNRVVDYITKPFEFDYLLSSVEKVFAKLEAETMREDLRRMITHDIKVPLNSIIGFSKFLQRGMGGELTAQGIEFTQKIADNSQRIVALLDNYLTQSRAESGKLELILLRFSFHNTVREALQLVEHEFERKNIEVRTNLDSESDHLIADENLMFRSVANLISNACKYTPENGEVEIKSYRSDDKELGEGIIFEIRNTGPGIEEHEIGLVFDKYKRVSSACGNPGSGIGLYVVMEVAKAHGGRIVCESVPDEWTTFRLFIPMIQNETQF
ncbi:MAG: HAMP domain-containing sensor histidine kinase [Candidatus Sumerlaeia bacterium]|nr:HAMP domain-containing sensor histidine kinase [Candidatus Sumerlaeia bacterium]